MKKRLLFLGLLVSASQLFATGCHPVARWRANHPGGIGCGACAPAFPLLHPIQTRRAVLGDSVGPVMSPVMGSPPCHGCASSHAVPGVPVSFGGGPGELVPVNHPTAGYPSIGYPSIGYPMPITPGPTVVPIYELPSPMPLPKNN